MGMAILIVLMFVAVGTVVWWLTSHTEFGRYQVYSVYDGSGKRVSPDGPPRLFTTLYMARDFRDRCFMHTPLYAMIDYGYSWKIYDTVTGEYVE